MLMRSRRVDVQRTAGRSAGPLGDRRIDRADGDHCLVSAEGVVRWSGRTELKGFRRLAALVLPRPWQLYVDRIEYSFVAMLWVLWTCESLAWSARPRR